MCGRFALMFRCLTPSQSKLSVDQVRTKLLPKSGIAVDEYVAKIKEAFTKQDIEEKCYTYELTAGTAPNTALVT